MTEEMIEYGIAPEKFSQYVASKDLVKIFALTYNGLFLQKLLSFLDGSYLTTENAKKLLHDIVLDSLEGMAIYFQTTNNQNTYFVFKDKTLVQLRNKIIVRLGKADKNLHIADQIITQLNHDLIDKKIRIEGFDLYSVNSHLVMKLVKNI